MLYIDVSKKVKTEHGIERLQINLKVHKGECIGIKGVTGAGKTTLFKLIGGLINPDKGEITFNNKVWYNQKMILPTRKRNIGYFIQNGVLYNHMTVLNNIKFSGAGEEESLELLALVSMYAFKDSLPHTLSGGQRQRILIARTLAKQKDLYLFDEPFASLDIRTAWHMADVIKEVQKKSPMILVSHDYELLSALSDRILIMENGRLYESNNKSGTCQGILRVMDLSKRRISV